MTWSTKKHLKEYLTKNLTVMANTHIRKLPTGTDHIAINLGFRVNHLVEVEADIKRNRPLCFYIAGLGYDIAWAKAVLAHRELYGIKKGIDPDGPPPKRLIIELLHEKAAENDIQLDPVKVAAMMR